MSSEMRELMQKWRDEAANPNSHIPAAGLLHCADALEAILGDDDEEECPHTMRSQDGDGSVMCCDCGALIAPVANELLEYRGALKACLKAMDVARDTIQPITTAQIRLHNLNPQTDKLLDAAADKAIALLARTEAGADDPILRGLARAVAEIDPNDGRWISCSGCHETEDGHPVGDYPHSPILGCALGGGCSECGGLGAVWDTTDYAAFAEELMADRPQDASGDAVDWKWQYRYQTVMRFMDNGATREAAERAALIDIAALESAAMQAKEAK